MLGLAVIFVVLLACAALFSASETAFFSLSRVQLHRFKESSKPLHRMIVRELRRPRDLLATILLGNEFSNVSLSVVATAALASLIPHNPLAETIAAVAIVTPLLLVLGEIFPKSIALSTSLHLAPYLILPLRIVRIVTFPLRAVLVFIAGLVIRLFGGKPDETQPLIMEEEYRSLIDLGRREGVLVEEEHELLHNVFEFTDTVVRDIMTPLDQLFMLPVAMPFETMLQEIKATAYSRIPIYEGERTQIIGVLHVQDLFTFDRRRRAGEHPDLRSVLYQPIVVGADEPIETLLRNFQRGQTHLAMVHDDEQRMIGAVTMHDVLETLFGEIED